MTFIINRVFVDSSLLIEAEKGNFTEFLNDLYFDNTKQLFINDNVVSEFLFHFIGLQTGKAPLTIKTRKEIPGVIEVYKKDEVLSNLEFVPSSREILSIVPDLMGKYNLLPNDAIILATCKINSISILATCDSDFIAPCKEEGITLLIPKK